MKAFLALNRWDLRITDVRDGDVFVRAVAGESLLFAEIVEWIDDHMVRSW